MLLLLRGFPVPPLCVFQDFDEYGHETREIADGQQSLVTSIYAFFEGRLPLPTQRIVDSVIPGCRVPLLAPGCYYTTKDGRNAISGLLREAIDKFTIKLLLMLSVPKELRGDIFRAMQLGDPLSMGQKLYACNSQVEWLAKRLEKHSFWRDTYRLGQAFTEDIHNLRYQGALEFIALECHAKRGTFYHALEQSTMAEWAGGRHDDLLFPGAESQISKRMECCAHVFHRNTYVEQLRQQAQRDGRELEKREREPGASGRTAAILMYQACLILEKEGYDFAVSERGCLAPWLDRVQREMQETRGSRGKLVHASGQQKFWSLWKPYLKTEVPGLKKRSDFANDTAYETARIVAHLGER